MICAAGYMCLFNPRAEGLTYALLALPCAIMISAGLYEGRERTLWIACAAMLFLLGANGLTPTTISATKHWFKPALFPILFVAMAAAIARTWTREAFAGLLDVRPRSSMEGTQLPSLASR